MTVPTLEVLERLGFEPEGDKHVFECGGLRLEAVECIGKSFQRIFLCSGIYRSDRRLMNISIELPLFLESFELGVALIVYGLGSSFSPTAPIPWFELGRTHHDLLPWVRSQKKYDARPICLIEREWFRLVAKKLRNFGEEAATNDLIGFSCDKAAVNIRTNNIHLAIPATVQNWTDTYYVRLSPMSLLPKRLTEMIMIEVWQENLTIARLRLPLVRNQ